MSITFPLDNNIIHIVNSLHADLTNAMNFDPDNFLLTKLWFLTLQGGGGEGRGGAEEKASQI